MLLLVPFSQIDTRAKRRGANGFPGTVSRMVIEPMQRKRGHILLERSNLWLDESSAVVGRKQNRNLDMSLCIHETISLDALRK